MGGQTTDEPLEVCSLWDSSGPQGVRPLDRKQYKSRLHKVTHYILPDSLEFVSQMLNSLLNVLNCKCEYPNKVAFLLRFSIICLKYMKYELLKGILFMEKDILTIHRKPSRAELKTLDKM